MSFWLVALAGRAGGTGECRMETERTWHVWRGARSGRSPQAGQGNLNLMSQAVGPLWVLEWGSDLEQDLRESAASCGVWLGGERAAGEVLGQARGWCRCSAGVEKMWTRVARGARRKGLGKPRLPVPWLRGEQRPVQSRGRRG